VPTSFAKTEAHLWLERLCVVPISPDLSSGVSTRPGSCCVRPSAVRGDEHSGVPSHAEGTEPTGPDGGHHPRSAPPTLFGPGPGVGGCWRKAMCRLL